LNSKFCPIAFFNCSTLAPAIAGIASKKEILLASNLLNLKSLAAVIVIPALLTPGIKASIWNKPIYSIVLKFKLDDIFLSNLLLSARYKIIPKINVVQAIIFKLFSNRLTRPVELIM
jgi:hypothetical protein